MLFRSQIEILAQDADRNRVRVHADDPFRQRRGIERGGTNPTADVEIDRIGRDVAIENVERRRLPSAGRNGIPELGVRIDDPGRSVPENNLAHEWSRHIIEFVLLASKILEGCARAVKATDLYRLNPGEELQASFKAIRSAPLRVEFGSLHGIRPRRAQRVFAAFASEGMTGRVAQRKSTTLTW